MKGACSLLSCDFLMKGVCLLLSCEYLDLWGLFTDFFPYLMQRFVLCKRIHFSFCQVFFPDILWSGHFVSSLLFCHMRVQTWPERLFFHTPYLIYEGFYSSGIWNAKAMCCLFYVCDANKCFLSLHLTGLCKGKPKEFLAMGWTEKLFPELRMIIKKIKDKSLTKFFWIFYRKILWKRELLIQGFKTTQDRTL